MSATLRQTGAALGLVILAAAGAWVAGLLPTPPAPPNPLRSLTSANAARTPSGATIAPAVTDGDSARTELRRGGKVIGWISVRHSAPTTPDAAAPGPVASAGGVVVIPASALAGTLGTKALIPNEIPMPSVGAPSGILTGSNEYSTVFANNRIGYDWFPPRTREVYTRPAHWRTFR